MKKQILKFKKENRKTDQLEFWVDGEKLVQLQNPKQGILPHDMVHYVVEMCFPFEGFIKLVFDGHEPGKVMEVLSGFAPKISREYSQASWITESLVESLQAALWSNNMTFDGFKYLYNKACEARKISAAPIEETDFNKCTSLVEKLVSNWSDLKAGETIELKFLPREEL